MSSVVTLVRYRNSRKGLVVPKFKFYFSKKESVEGEGETSYLAFLDAGCPEGAMEAVVNYECIGTTPTNSQHKGELWNIL